MCLYDKKRFRFTFKRIPIYKVVRLKAGCKGVKVCSPFTRTELKHYNVIPLFSREFPKKSYSTWDYLLYSFSRGFYHAVINRNDIYYLNLDFTKSEIQVVKGYIPAFTRYATNGIEIAARRIVLENIDSNGYFTKPI